MSACWAMPAVVLGPVPDTCAAERNLLHAIIVGIGVSACTSSSQPWHWVELTGTGTLERGLAQTQRSPRAGSRGGVLLLPITTPHVH